MQCRRRSPFYLYWSCSVALVTKKLDFPDVRILGLSTLHIKCKEECWVPACLCVHILVLASRWCYTLHIVGRSVVNCFWRWWLVSLSLLCSRTVYFQKRFLLRDIPRSHWRTKSRCNSEDEGQRQPGVCHSSLLHHVDEQHPCTWVP